MRTSGRSYEGWMALIPLGVLIFIVTVALGGPEAFVMTVVNFVTDAVADLATWIRNF